jgi:hypothetical protein
MTPSSSCRTGSGDPPVSALLWRSSSAMHWWILLLRRTRPATGVWKWTQNRPEPRCSKRKVTLICSIKGRQNAHCNMSYLTCMMKMRISSVNESLSSQPFTSRMEWRRVPWMHLGIALLMYLWSWENRRIYIDCIFCEMEYVGGN